MKRVKNTASHVLTFARSSLRAPLTHAPLRRLPRQMSRMACCHHELSAPPELICENSCDGCRPGSPPAGQQPGRTFSRASGHGSPSIVLETEPDKAARPPHFHAKNQRSRVIVGEGSSAKSAHGLMRSTCPIPKAIGLSAW